jgi:hypothetical protein
MFLHVSTVLSLILSIFGRDSWGDYGGFSEKGVTSSMRTYCIQWYIPMVEVVTLNNVVSSWANCFWKRGVFTCLIKVLPAMCRYIHTYIHTCMHACIHACVHTFTMGSFRCEGHNKTVTNTCHSSMHDSLTHDLYHEGHLKYHYWDFKENIVVTHPPGRVARLIIFTHSVCTIHNPLSHDVHIQ